MPYNYVVPANAILVHGVPLNEEFIAAPGSAILPGDIVEFNTQYCADGEGKIVESPANSEHTLGVAEQSHEADRDTVYTAGDPVRVINGDIIVILRLAAGNAITCGDNLKTAASGEVQELDCEAGTDDPDENACLLVARARVSLGSSTLVQWILAKLFI